MKQIQQEKPYKVICISLGRNEHQLLKYLDRHKESKNQLNRIFEDNRHNKSLSYINSLCLCLGRLQRKNLVKMTEDEFGVYFEITHKGELLLEVIRKE